MGHGLPLYQSHQQLHLSRAGQELLKLLNNPATHRLYLSRLHELCQTIFTADYITPWLAHYGSVVGQNYLGSAAYIQARRDYVLSQLPARQPFAITVNGGQGLATNPPVATFSGTGWLDIGWISLAGGTDPLPLTWTSDTNWQASVPLPLGVNLVALAAYDRAGLHPMHPKTKKRNQKISRNQNN